MRRLFVPPLLFGGSGGRVRQAAVPMAQRGRPPNTEGIVLPGFSLPDLFRFAYRAEELSVTAKLDVQVPGDGRYTCDTQGKATRLAGGFFSTPGSQKPPRVRDLLIFNTVLPVVSGSLPGQYQPLNEQGQPQAGQDAQIPFFLGNSDGNGVLFFDPETRFYLPAGLAVTLGPANQQLGGITGEIFGQPFSIERTGLGSYAGTAQLSVEFVAGSELAF